MSSRTEVLLVLRAQSGDREALDQLFRGIQVPLFRCIRSICLRTDLAEDILQDVFLIIYRKLTWLQHPEYFKAWAYRIASREALRRVRHERKLPTYSPAGLDEENLLSLVEPALNILEKSDFHRALPGLVSRVSPASRAVLVLHYLEELSLAEVADVLGIPAGTVKSRLASGLAQLRQLLGVAGPEPKPRKA